MKLYADVTARLMRLLGQGRTHSEHSKISPDVITVYIAEEYGFRHWVARLTSEEYRDLIRRWETMRGLGCLVPVTRIIPQATELQTEELAYLKADVRCHIHVCEDSYLEGSSYKIPPSPDGRFWIDDKSSNALVDFGGECPDVLISKAVSTTDVESALAEAVASGKVAVIEEDQNREDFPLDCSTLAILLRASDPHWPTRIRFTFLASENALGGFPHLTLAKHFSERLSASTLTEPWGLEPESGSYPDAADWWAVRRDGAWYLAEWTWGLTAERLIPAKPHID